VAKLFMGIEGTTTDELYCQLKDLRCNDSNEEVWALAEKQAALPKKTVCKCGHGTPWRQTGGGTLVHLARKSSRSLQ
jgi:hypothetical protein